VIENDFDTGIGFSWHPRCVAITLSAYQWASLVLSKDVHKI